MSYLTYIVKTIVWGDFYVDIDWFGGGEGLDMQVWNKIVMLSSLIVILPIYIFN